MDLGTVRKKLKGNKYKKMDDVLEDIQQTWNNCKLYNQEGSVIDKFSIQKWLIFALVDL